MTATSTPSLLLTKRLNLEHPIIQGPMTGSDTPALAAAVSKAGALGMLGCGMRSPAAMEEAANAVRQATDRPFGMNLFVQKTPTPDPAIVKQAMDRLAPLYAEFGLTPSVPAQWCEDFDAQLEALIAQKPAVASFTFGILSRPQVERLHAAGSYVIGTATTVAEAEAWQNVGADAVVASGMEAGGHRGTFLGDFQSSMIGTLPLVAECAARLTTIPVIAAGGIMNGRSIAASLTLGAQAVQMGTAFLACPESGIGAAYRDAMAQATAVDTRCTRTISGRYARGIVNPLMSRLADFEDAVPDYPVQNALTGALRKACGAAGRADYLSLWAGQGVGAARVLPASELVGVLVDELRAALLGR
ncbi:NAD(P)H-dependent flavin oxidoreductase [Diaphorobacter caeni]|uniref:NAD(P)H-dependent flavin oxidoreductase n=1 Tax=Diaphorobacter caeni TaxID=2784387 RepID=UPI00188E0A3A|nr:nitronate monooxygenase family protein [Diaphorobacter caeni]MBF5005452.1 nitronate monooxygenase [Diaphorobacter caeni]